MRLRSWSGRWLVAKYDYYSIIEDADYVFPDAREGNIPIGTFQTFDEFQIEDIGEDGTWDILLVGIYGIEEELCQDIRVYTENGEGFTLNMQLTQELNEKYANEGIVKSFSITENNGDNKETLQEDSFTLMTGDMGNLGIETLAYTVPNTDAEDYRLYINTGVK